MNPLIEELTKEQLRSDIPAFRPGDTVRVLSLIHISEPTRRTPISYAVFCLKKKKPPESASLIIR